MRGESGDVGVGMMGGPGGVVDPELARAGAKTPVSPPLSAAASTVSLVPSDLTTSDPDLTLSSAASTVSSSGVTTPDLQPPSASEDDRSEPPMSPSEEEPPEPPIPLEEEEEEEEMEVEDQNSSETPSVTSEGDHMAPLTPTDSSNPSEEQYSLSTPDQQEQVLHDSGMTPMEEVVEEEAKEKEDQISNAAATPAHPDLWQYEDTQNLPTPEAYRAETVEFPTSPMALKTSRRMSGVCFAGEEELERMAPSTAEDSATTNTMTTTPLSNSLEDSTDSTPPATHNSSSSSNFLTPNFRPDSLKPEGSSKKEDGFEVNSDIEDEEYFEEFHLPNTHENAFVRHKSFRRKVQLTPINAPDAERIEGLVMTGELQRHGSIRRKIVPESHDASKTSSHSSTSTFERDLKEIKSMLDECEIDEEEGYSADQDSSILKTSTLSNNSSSVPSTPHSQYGQQANTSTPKTDNTDESINIMTDITDIGSEQYESLSIEQSTKEKIMECLDTEKSKDLYVITGKLQDILSPTEVEEVLNNSEHYSDYLNKEILEALSNSLQEHLGPSNKTGNTDSGISSPKKLTLISAQGFELGSTGEKMDFMATLDESEQSENNSSADQSQDKTAPEDAEDDGINLRLEKRRSLVLNKGDKELEVEAIFVESNNQNTGLKKIPAPSLHLTPTTDDGLDDTLETIQESPFVQVSEIRELQVPDIVITGSSSDTEEASTPQIFLRSSDLSSTTTVTTPSSIDQTQPEFSPTIENNDNRPASLNLDSALRRKIAVTDDILRSPVDDDSISVSSAFSQNDEGEVNEEDLTLPEEHEEEEWKPADPYTTMPPPQLIPELTAAEETAEERHWRSVVIGGVWRRIDMKVIAPYRKCLSHGGYIGDDQNAIIVFSSCFLPDRSRRDYNYVMDNLFLYVLSMLEQLVTEDYVLVYLSGGTPRSHMPNFQWLKRAYQMIDRKLRKNLKALHVVHPTFWVRTVVALTRPFISTKFYKKLTFVNNLTELAQILPLDKLEIPDAVKHHDGKRRTVLSLLGLGPDQSERTLS